MKDIKIRRAWSSETDQLTALSMRSKQSNGYDDAFMAACLEELTITPADVRDGEYWVAVSDNLLGMVCFNIDKSMAAAEISAYFVDPGCQKMGVGRLLWNKVLERAKASSIRKLYLDADPNAVPFYQLLGFKTVRQVPSGSIEGRFIPHMEMLFD